MPKFVPVDYVFLGIIVVFAVIALVKGFIQEVFGKASWVCAIIGAILFYAKISALFHNNLKSVLLCNILGFLSLFIVIFVVVKLVGLLVSKLCEISVIKGLDRALGVLFGIVEGFAVITLILFLLKTQTFFDTTELLDNSFFYGIIKNFLQHPEVQDVITNNSDKLNEALPKTTPAA